MRAGWWAVLALACAGEGAAPSPVADADTAVPDPLSADRYPFCVGPVPDDARAWCGWLEQAPEEACPALRQACAEDRFVPTGCGVEGAGAGDDPPGDSAGAPVAPVRLPEALQGCEVPEGCAAEPRERPRLSPALRWLVALGVALLVVALGRLVWRARGAWSRLPEAPEGPGVSLEALASDVPALPEEVLLAEARRALAAGALGEAVLYARAAALRRLAREGRLELQRARTDREYLRRLRRDPAGDGLRTIVEAVEAWRWAGRGLSREAASDAVAAAARLVGTAALLLWAGAARAVDRYGPDGDAAVIALWRGSGHEVEVAAGALDLLDARADVAVIDLDRIDAGATPPRRLRAWLDAGGVLVTGGGEPLSLLPDTPDGVSVGRSDRARVVPTPAWEALGLPTPVWSGDGPRRTWCAVPEVTVLLRPQEGAPVPDVSRDGVDPGTAGEACADPVVAWWLPVGDGALVAFSDARLLRNGALLLPENREVLARLVRRGAAAGWWTLPGERPRILVALAARPPGPPGALQGAGLLPFVLQLSALWLVAALWRGWPFTPPRDPPARGRDRSAEHAEALAARWEALGATRHAAAVQAGLWLRRLGPDGLRAAAIRHGASDAAAARLVARAEAVVATPDGPDGPDDLTLVEDLWHLTRPR